MSIYTIADLHLSFGTDKPMDIFGWGNHSEKIKQNWLENVNTGDTVVIPGDFSWGMTLEESCKDFAFLDDLPGKKILAKGNHDYWWTTMNKMNVFLQKNEFKTINFLQNNSFLCEDKIIVGTRGWVTNISNEDDYKVLRRENERLKLSILSGIKNYGSEKEMICFFHYPPFFKEKVPEEIDFFKLMKEYNISKCYYGHLHGDSHKDAFEGCIDGINFELISCDYLNFNLKLID